jgi:hypothetical protein
MAPRITCICPTTGYYRALHEGEGATFTSIEEIGEEEQVHWAAAAAEAEPTLKEALNGPDGAEWQAAIDYEIGQLERLGVWQIIDPPPRANIIPCHFVLATKRGADGEKLKLRARLVAVRGHPSISLPPLSSPTLPLFICIIPTPLYHFQEPHPKADNLRIQSPMMFWMSTHHKSSTFRSLLRSHPNDIGHASDALG